MAAALKSQCDGQGHRTREEDEEWGESKIERGRVRSTMESVAAAQSMLLGHDGGRKTLFSM